MGIEIDLSKRILASQEVIWSLLGNPGSWAKWWRDCEVSQVKGGRSAREGSELELVLKPGASAINYHPVIDLYTEERTLSLTHRGGLSQATCVWYLNKSQNGTVVRVQLVYEGPGSLFVRLTGRSALVRLAIENQLKDLKKFAERMV